MSRIIALIFFIVVLCVSSLGSTPTAHAMNEFSTDLSSTYSVGKNGTTQVTLLFTITNQVSTVFATEYAIEIGTARAEQIRVKSDGIIVTTNVTAQNNSTIVSFQFPKPVVGKGKSHTVELSYTTKDLAIVTDKTIEFTIPKLSKQASIDTYSITLTVPKEYGIATAVTDKSYTTSVEGDKSVVHFASPSQEKSISVLFGKEQTNRVELIYDLHNSSSVKSETAIAIPSDSAYQRVFINSIDPKPTQLSSDADGNWLATYALEPDERKTIQATVTITTSLFAHPSWEETPIVPRELTKKDTFWDVSDGSIQKKPVN